MTIRLNIPDYIQSIKPYVPGKPLEELEREYGISDSIKLASNENPLGPSPRALDAIRRAADNVHRYPDGSGYYLVKKLAEHLSVPADNLVLGNGSDELLGMLACAFFRPGDEAIMPLPSFLMYDITVRASGAVPVAVPLDGFAIDLDAMAQKVTERTRVIFLTNPNNPTGMVIAQSEFERFIGLLPDHIIVIIDEAYIEFARDPQCLKSLALDYHDRPIVILRTFSKAYGLAGLRIGYGVMSPEIASILHRVRMPFNASSIAQEGALAALDDKDFLKKTQALIHQELEFLYEGVRRIGLDYLPTQANFFLIDLKTDADRIFTAMLKEGVIVRSMTSYGYPTYIRVTVGLHQENIRFLSALEKTLE